MTLYMVLCVSDEHLYLFLHSNYYNINETKNTIENYFQIRSSSPELFSNKSLRTAINQAAWDIS